MVTFGATSFTRTLQARALTPLMSMASEPQMPWAHDRRRASVPSWYHFTSVQGVEEPVHRARP